MLIRTYADIQSLKGNAALNPAEKKVIDNCIRGELTILGSGTRPKRSSKARTIRADLLRYLILGGCDQCRVHEMGVLVDGAWIVGKLDLSFARAKGAVHLSNSTFAEPFLASEASFDRLVLNGSSLVGLNAEGVRIRGHVLLDEAKSTGPVSFGGAEIGGQFSCSDAELNGEQDSALNAQSAMIRGGVFLQNLKSTGEVSVAGADIGGQLSAKGAELIGGEGFALNAQSATIRGGAFLDNLKSTGGVSFAGSEIGAILSARGAELIGGEGFALNAQSARIRGSAFLDNLKSTGGVSFAGSEIGAILSAKGAKLNGGEGFALTAQSATIRGGAFLENLKSVGEVSFAGSEIGAVLSVKEAELDGGEGNAFNAQSATIRGDAFLDNFKSTGEVSFPGAEIDGQLSFHGAELNGGNGYALNAQRIVVREGLYWRQLKIVVGRIDLNTAHLGDLVDDEQSWNEVFSLSLVGMTYEDLAGPHDLPSRKLWLKKGAKFIGQFHPQPYQQLAKFYRETGHRHEAREILIEKEKEQRKAVRTSICSATKELHSGSPPPLRTILPWLKYVRRRYIDFFLLPWLKFGLNWFWDKLSRRITGYGYKPWLSFGPLLTLVAAMAILSHITWKQGDFAPNSDVILTSADWKAHTEGTTERPPSATPAADWSNGPNRQTGEGAGPGRDYETFNALAYGVDVVVPVLNLGQTAAWAPSTSRGPWGWWLFYLQKLFIIAGWGVTAIVAASISGMIRRDD